MTVLDLIIAIVVALWLLCFWAYRTLNRVRPFYAQPGPTPKQIRAWKKDRVLMVVPNRKVP